MAEQKIHPEIAFLVSKNETHHMSYLSPYLDHWENKTLIELNEIKQYDLSQYKMLISSNYYRSIEPVLYNQNYYNIYICHGIPHKLLNTENYNWFWTYDTSVLFSQKDIIQIARHNKIDLPEMGDQKSIFLEHNGRKHLFIIAGNQRLKSYLKTSPSIKEIYSKHPLLDPKKQTLLYMPSVNSLQYSHGKNLCGIDFFCAKIIPYLKKDYNLIIKAHPNNQSDEIACMILNRMKELIPNLLIDFESNYLDFMQISDLLFSDFSSAGYDYLYFNKPIIFLDKFDEIYKKPSLDDIFHPYWFYGAGEIITQDQVSNIEHVIQEQLCNDPYQEIRKNYKEMSFEDSLNEQQILDICKQHPKHDR